MQSLAQSGYTAPEVDSVLHGPAVTWNFRYDLLDLNNKFKANLNKIKSCTVKNNAEADIKRTANFSLTDDGTINFLQDRIKPYARLKMPPDVIPTMYITNSKLFHFDTDLNSTQNLTPNAGYVVTLRPNEGKFGGAVAVEPATTNLFSALESQNLTVATTKSLTAGTYTVAVNGGSGSIALSGGPIGTATLYNSVTFTLAVTTSVTFTPTGTVTQCQLEQHGFATSWVLGGSTRLAGQLAYDIIPASGDFTIHCNVKPNIAWDDKVTSNGSSMPLIDFMFTLGTPGTDGFTVMSRRDLASPSIDLETYPVTYDTRFTHSYTGKTISTIDIVVSGSNVSLYVDGNFKGTHAIVRPTSPTLKLYRDTTYGYFGLYDELLVTPRSASADEISYWYNANIPFNDVIRNGWAEFPLGVFLLTTTPINIDATYTLSRDVGAYDLLKILIDDKVSDRYIVSTGANYITQISSILTGAGLTQQNLLPSILTVPAVLEWAPGTTKLQIINDLLGAINYKSLWMDENGTACATSYISPMDRPSEYTYSDDAKGIFFPDMVDTLDLASVPNKWVVVVSESTRPPLVSTYTNSNPQSLTSTVNRGRTIVDFRTNNQAADQATLDSSVLRIATEASQIFEHVDFDTGLMPIHSNDDVFTLNYSKLGISAKFKEVQWEQPLIAGARMKHTIRRVVYI